MFPLYFRHNFLLLRLLIIDDRSIAGRVAIVTGAASGMGRATAHLFADEGAKVAICDVNADAVQAVADEIADAGGTVMSRRVDLADAAAKAVAAVPGA